MLVVVLKHEGSNTSDESVPVMLAMDENVINHGVAVMNIKTSEYLKFTLEKVERDVNFRLVLSSSITNG